MGSYSYSQPSSSDGETPKSEENIESQDIDVDEEVAHGDNGFIRECFCGGAVSLETMSAGAHAGRLYYKCENSGNGRVHINKAWDLAVEQEIWSLREILQETHNRTTYFTRTIGTGALVDPPTMWATVGLHEQEIDLLHTQFNALEAMVYQKEERSLVGRLHRVSAYMRNLGALPTNCLCLIMSLIAVMVSIWK